MRDAESIARRKRTVAVLTERGVPHFDGLPVLACDKYAKIRPCSEVAFRSAALCTVMMKAFDFDPDTYEEIQTDPDVQSALSPDETAFLQNGSPDEFSVSQFTWRCESCWTLLWSLGFVESLVPPVVQCDIEDILDIFVEGFLGRANLRPADQIFDAHDLAYLYHWSVRRAGVGEVHLESEANPSIVIERHYALNWLISYCDQDWDKVTLDT